MIFRRPAVKRPPLNFCVRRCTRSRPCSPLHYSLARLWMHWASPRRHARHSIGEFSACCLAGVSLDAVTMESPAPA